ncbi:MAG: hypothetical protein J7L99_01500 [Planctomycetes bacterium]|nr:hypothetical protein [Planctomycetota bacterium]
MAEIVYFDTPGPQNTSAIVEIVKKRCAELGIEHVVVASDSGATAMKMREALPESVKIVAIPEHAGYKGGDASSITPEARKQLEEKGIKVLICSHALSGVARSITNKFGGISHIEIIAYTLRLFGCEGIKVAVEVAVMAADAGEVPTDREIIAVGGTGKGADTAIVLKSAHMTNFFDLEIREILAKPRQRTF